MRAKRLSQLRYTAQYKLQLAKGWSAFLAFIRSRNIDVSVISRSALTADKSLVEFAEHQFQQADASGFNRTKHAILAVQHKFRNHKGKLGQAWDTLETWLQQHPYRPRPPMPHLCMQAVCCLVRVFAMFGQSSSVRHMLLVFAALMEAGFYGLLRSGELMALTRANLVLPQDGLWDDNEFAIVTIDAPKNRRQLGMTQFAMVRSQEATQWLAYVFGHYQPHQKLWPWAPIRFRTILRNALSRLGLDQLGLNTSSLRAGGATWMFVRGTEISRLKFYGRWASEKTLAHYVQEAVSAQIVNGLPSHVALRLKEIVSAGAHTFLPPKAVPSWSLS